MTPLARQRHHGAAESRTAARPHRWHTTSRARPGGADRGGTPVRDRGAGGPPGHGPRRLSILWILRTLLHANWHWPFPGPMGNRPEEGRPTHAASGGSGTPTAGPTPQARRATAAGAAQEDGDLEAHAAQAAEPDEDDEDQEPSALDAGAPRAHRREPGLRALRELLGRQPTGPAGVARALALRRRASRAGGLMPAPRFRGRPASAASAEAYRKDNVPADEGVPQAAPGHAAHADGHAAHADGHAAHAAYARAGCCCARPLPARAALLILRMGVALLREPLAPPRGWTGAVHRYGPGEPVTPWGDWSEDTEPSSPHGARIRTGLSLVEEFTGASASQHDDIGPSRPGQATGGFGAAAATALRSLGGTLPAHGGLTMARYPSLSVAEPPQRHGHLMPISGFAVATDAGRYLYDDPVAGRRSSPTPDQDRPQGALGGLWDKWGGLDRAARREDEPDRMQTTAGGGLRGPGDAAASEVRRTRCCERPRRPGRAGNDPGDGSAAKEADEDAGPAQALAAPRASACATDAAHLLGRREAGQGRFSRTGIGGAGGPRPPGSSNGATKAHGGRPAQAGSSPAGSVATEPAASHGKQKAGPGQATPARLVGAAASSAAGQPEGEDAGPGQACPGQACRAAAMPAAALEEEAAGPGQAAQARPPGEAPALAAGGEVVVEDAGPGPAGQARQNGEAAVHAAALRMGENAGPGQAARARAAGAASVLFTDAVRMEDAGPGQAAPVRHAQ